MRETTSIEEWLKKPYWVIDLLPWQVPKDGDGQYFRIEAYYRAHPQVDALYRKFAHILLKLNCYVDMDVSLDGEQWLRNPAPEDFVAMVEQSLALKCMLYVALLPGEGLVTLSADDCYMTVYDPSEATRALLRALVSAEGLFLWKPENNNCEVFGLDDKLNKTNSQ